MKVTVNYKYDDIRTEDMKQPLIFLYLEKRRRVQKWPLNVSV